TLGAAESYTGSTVVAAGILTVGAGAAALPGGTALSVAPGATFDMGGKSLQVAAIEGNGTITSSSGTPTLTVSTISGGTVWVEDSLPATDNGIGTWVSSNPTPFSGSLALQSVNALGTHQDYFQGASNTIVVNSGDTLVAYV